MRTTKRMEALIGADRKAVIRAIRDARTRAGLTQEQAASHRSRRATSTISRWESGALPKTWDDLIEYAYALDQEIVLRFGPHRKEAGPDWDRLMQRVDAIARKLRVPEIVEEEAEHAFRAARDETRRGRARGDGSDGRASGGEVQGGRKPRPDPK